MLIKPPPLRLSSRDFTHALRRVGPIIRKPWGCPYFLHSELPKAALLQTPCAREAREVARHVAQIELGAVVLLEYV